MTLFKGQCKVCVDGLMGKVCNESCDLFKYGSNCKYTCTNCLLGCNSDGICLKNLCKKGFVGENCQEECHVGFFGRNCSSKCSNCAHNICNKTDGRCLSGCLAGWQGSTCNIVCSPGTFGQSCNKRCSQNCLEEPCNVVTGNCPNLKCKSGYTGDQCQSLCSSGLWGTGCSQVCSDNCKSLPCHHATGECPSQQCKAGFIGPRCEKFCPKGFYGVKCLERCGYCSSGRQSCDTITGFCKPANLGCDDGYTGPRCKKVCPNGSWGKNCQFYCSTRCFFKMANPVCNSRNGSCFRLSCDAGWVGLRCEEMCPLGKYGMACKKSCGHCWGSSPCDRVDGSCPEKDIRCLKGYTGSKCEAPCPFGTYGSNCALRCSTNCRKKGCDPIDGHCPQGSCKAGFKGKNCTIPCSEGEFGENCEQKCGFCLHKFGNCNSETGHCLSSKCLPGYTGNRCIDLCPEGTYGFDCLKSCKSYRPEPQTRKIKSFQFVTTPFIKTKKDPKRAIPSINIHKTDDTGIYRCRGGTLEHLSGKKCKLTIWKNTTVDLQTLEKLRGEKDKVNYAMLFLLSSGTLIVGLILGVSCGFYCSNRYSKLKGSSSANISLSKIAYDHSENTLLSRIQYPPMPQKQLEKSEIQVSDLIIVFRSISIKLF